MLAGRGAEVHEAACAGVVLAAGRSLRMGRPKALLPWGGRPAVLAIAETLRCCAFRVLVVRPDADWLSDEIRAAFTVVTNPAPERGMLSSLQCGLAAARSQGATLALVTPVDCPGVRPETAERLLQAHAGAPRPVVPAWQGRPGHPVLLDGPAIAAVLAAAPAHSTLRQLLAGLDVTPLLLVVADPAVADNFNTPGDLGAPGGGR